MCPSLPGTRGSFHMSCFLRLRSFCLSKRAFLQLLVIQNTLSVAEFSTAADLSTSLPEQEQPSLLQVQRCDSDACLLSPNCGSPHSLLKVLASTVGIGRSGHHSTSFPKEISFPSSLTCFPSNNFFPCLLCKTFMYLKPHFWHEILPALWLQPRWKPKWLHLNMLHTI